MVIKVMPNDKGSLESLKLADIEVCFTSDEGALDGLRLIGFAVWERRGGGRNVTFPSRTYVVNGERRAFSLLRPSVAESDQRLRDRILEAYAEFESQLQHAAEA